MRFAVEPDERAFDDLFICHRDGIRGFLYRRLRDHEETEDAVILAFCKAWRARDSFREDSSPKAWLYQIAQRVALDVLRRKARRPAEHALDALVSERGGEAWDAGAHDPLDHDPLEALLNSCAEQERRARVRAAMDRLPACERRLLALCYFRGLSYEEIASRLGISVSLVRGRLHRTRARLRGLLEREFGQERE